MSIIIWRSVHAGHSHRDFRLKSPKCVAMTYSKLAPSLQPLTVSYTYLLPWCLWAFHGCSVGCVGTMVGTYDSKYSLLQKGGVCVWILLFIFSTATTTYMTEMSVQYIIVVRIAYFEEGGLRSNIRRRAPAVTPPHSLYCTPPSTFTPTAKRL